jgi:hypothetical protein
VERPRIPVLTLFPTSLNGCHVSKCNRVIVLLTCHLAKALNLRHLELRGIGFREPQEFTATRSGLPNQVYLTRLQWYRQVCQAIAVGVLGIKVCITCVSSKFTRPSVLFHRLGTWADTRVPLSQEAWF